MKAMNVSDGIRLANEDGMRLYASCELQQSDLSSKHLETIVRILMLLRSRCNVELGQSKLNLHNAGSVYKVSSNSVTGFSYTLSNLAFKLN